MQAVKYRQTLTGRYSPTGDLSVAGNKTVSLTACAPGVMATEPQYFVYVVGHGNGGGGAGYRRNMQREMDSRGHCNLPRPVRTQRDTPSAAHREDCRKP